MSLLLFIALQLINNYQFVKKHNIQQHFYLRLLSRLKPSHN